LRDTDLQGAKFDFADLRNADLQGANLGHAHLDDAFDRFGVKLKDPRSYKAEVL
jgi:uncharacterized protein YjbI with pentapeptide repeats